MTYNKTNWQNGDIITADKLNNLENGVSSINTVEETLGTKINAEQAVTACMPSSNYINLELGASGTQYTPPASGYVTLAGVMSTADKFAFLRIPEIALGLGKPPSSPTATVRQYIPVSKNLKFTVDYSGPFNDGLIFRFIYAEGNKPNS